MSASLYVGDDLILWGVVANAGLHSSECLPRWAHVKHATGMGSTRSAELCRRFQFDPDEEVGGTHGGEVSDGK